MVSYVIIGLIMSIFVSSTAAAFDAQLAEEIF
jgi:hypothetical protein